MDELKQWKFQLMIQLASLNGTLTFFPKGMEKKIAHHQSQRLPAEVYADAELSPYFCNLRTAENGGDKQGTLPQHSVDLIGECLFRLLPADQPTRVVAGIPNAGNAIAKSVVAAAVKQGIVLKQAMFRKEDSVQGRRFQRDSDDFGAVEAVFDDLITVADVKFRFLSALAASSAAKPPLYVLVDRQEGGADILAALGYTVTSAIKIEELLPFCIENGRIDHGMADRLLAYAKRRRELIASKMDEITRDLRDNVLI